MYSNSFHEPIPKIFSAPQFGLKSKPSGRQLVSQGVPLFFSLSLIQIQQYPQRLRHVVVSLKVF